MGTSKSGSGGRLASQKKKMVISRLEKLENPPADLFNEVDIFNRLRKDSAFRGDRDYNLRKLVREAVTELKPRQRQRQAALSEYESNSKRRKLNVRKQNDDEHELVEVSSSDDNIDRVKSEAKSSVSRDVEEVKEKEGPTFSDLGGMQKVIKDLNDEIIKPMRLPWLPPMIGVQQRSGILLSGPPGCGKTTLARAIANETGLPFFKIDATEVVTSLSGASEENIRMLFTEAYDKAPSIVFIDEIDAIASKREDARRGMERRIVTQLLTCMSSERKKSCHVLVIGATNRPDDLDPALRRPGRFDREIVLGVPDENARLGILTAIIRKLKLVATLDVPKLARSTIGYVGADLEELANKAGNIAINRIYDEIEDRIEDFCKPPEDTQKFGINMSDFEEALLVVQPSLKREGFSEVPNVKWEDIGGLDLVRKQFERCVVKLIKDPESSKKFNVKTETGILLYGPPGCGKTLIAKAVANESGASFIYIKGPELLDKFVGESEKAVRKLFSRARQSPPCIIFFDEVDSLTTARKTEGGLPVVESVLNQLLLELDGADPRKGVFVIGATNRPDTVEPALLRPGRFGKRIYVSPPTTEERGLILKAVARKYPIDASVNLAEIGKWKACENFSGADLAELINEAAIIARDELETLAESSDTVTPTIKETHFQSAVAEIKPSVTKMQLLRYQKYAESPEARGN